MISIFSLFSIGIGPSSSHTIGPMKAANEFIQEIVQKQLKDNVSRIQVELFGSLAFTGKGHGTDNAILLGLEGHKPDKVDADLVTPRAEEIKSSGSLLLDGNKAISFNYNNDLLFDFKVLLPAHTNGMRFTAYSESEQLLSSIYYSIGGGFILNEDQTTHPPKDDIENPPHPFSSGKSLLEQCEQNRLTISELMRENEASISTANEVDQKCLAIVSAMRQSIEKGCHVTGTLPGGLNVKRRAPELQQKLLEKGRPKSYEHLDSMAWLNLFAIAVNEENAAGGRVVTAPTNGASGIIPAVIEYYISFYPNITDKDIANFLLTAGAIGVIYKKNASISGAEVGCQGEVGVACSMAAAALTEALGGNLYQIENAAEIAMEHHLGLTCDPINGLVQIPCIERNAMGAVKAVNAARLAMLGDGEHYVSLDKVVATMRQTGKDMMTIYKETSQGGLAANLPEC